ncbi:MAG: hypothetical protein ACWGSD_05245, partial [Thermodesulfobacteriota bacterium]
APGCRDSLSEGPSSGRPRASVAHWRRGRLRRPLEREGIGTAMQSGWMAADCAANALRHGIPARLASVAYASSCRREIVWNLGLAHLVQSILLRPPFGSTEQILDAFVEKAQGNPRMARALARLIIGDLSRTAFLDARNWAKLWRAWLQK